MKKSDLYREWARVLDMCEGTEVDPVDCWKLNGVLQHTWPSFAGVISSYSFMVAILEGKPVFVGDKLWTNICDMYVTVSAEFKSFNGLSWNQPKKTFMLNGVELPCPTKEKAKSRLMIHCLFNDNQNEVDYFDFDGDFDSKKVFDAIVKSIYGNNK